MHDNGDRDPLDGWLSQQVQPLPPPPGTFELITRRARRRKVRKLAVTVASAAAVAAAVAVAVPGGLLLHLSPSKVNEQPVAEGASSTPSTHGSQSSNGSGTPLPTRTTPSGTPSGPPSTGTSAHPVPPNFQPTSVTFVSTSDAWVIGQAGTPGHCADANPYYCTSLAHTTDAGQSWQGGPAPKTGPPSGAAGVSGIRFLDGVNGWAFGPQLWVTHDSGNSWQQISTNGQRVTDLETVNGHAYALWATCSGTSAAGFALNCTSYTLMTTAAGSDNWAAVGNPTSNMTDGANGTSGFIALTGSKGYLVAPDGTLYGGPIGKTWSKQGTARCQPGTPQASGLPSNALFATPSPTSLAMACQATAATSPPTIYTSGDSGASWTAQPASAWGGLQDIGTITSLCAGPNGTLVLATSNGLYTLPQGATQWQRAAQSQGVPQGGFTYVGMTSDMQGVAVPADARLSEIWMTFNGGLTWAPVTSITPGH